MTSTRLEVLARFLEAGQELRLIEHNDACGGWALNPYLACDLRCRYCITGAQGVSRPRVPTEELVDRLHRELDDIPADAPLAIGGLSDAYPRAEADLGLTRTTLALLVGRARPFTVITKGDTVLRDIDLLSLPEAKQVTISLCTVDERALSTVDLDAPSAVRRLEVIATLRAAGVRVTVSAMPWIPGISDAAALIEQLPPEVPVRFAPLNVVSPMVAATTFGARFDQHEVNEAYLDAARSAPWRPGVRWSPPIPTDGSTPQPFENLIDLPVAGRRLARH